MNVILTKVLKLNSLTLIRFEGGIEQLSREEGGDVFCACIRMKNLLGNNDVVMLMKGLPNKSSIEAKEKLNKMWKNSVFKIV